MSTSVAASSGQVLGRREAMREPLLLAAAGLAAVTTLRLHDPHHHAGYGLCPFHVVTHLWCPGCGGLRAVNDLSRLDPAAAVSSNVLVVALVGIVAIAYVWWLPKRWRGERATMLIVGPRCGAAVLVASVAFTVVRNLPVGAWLAP